MSKLAILENWAAKLGSSKSGNWGHKGRPGEVGGSATRSVGVMYIPGESPKNRASREKVGDLLGWEPIENSKLVDGNVAYLRGDLDGKHEILTYYPVDSWRETEEWKVQTYAKGVPSRISDRRFDSKEDALQDADAWRKTQGWAETGTIDSSYFKSGPGKRMITSDVPKDIKEIIQEEFISRQVPLDHLAKMQYITTKYNPKWYGVDSSGNFRSIRREEGGAYAYYDKSGGGRMVISPAMVRDMRSGYRHGVDTLFHELGHNVHIRAPKRVTNMTGRLNKALKDARSLPSNRLRGLGLRDYSLTNDKELFADMYAVWVRQPTMRVGIRDFASKHGLDMDIVMEGYK